MLIYRCIMCNRIFGLPSPSALPKCRWCGGRLVYVGKDYHPNASSVKKANEKKGNINYKALWDFLKALGVIWGTGGTVNITRKSLKKEKIGKGDLFHTIFPWATAGIIHCIQHPQGVKNFFVASSPQIGIPPQTGTEEKLQKMIKHIKNQDNEKDTQRLPQVTNERKADVASKVSEDRPKKIDHLLSENSERIGDPKALEWLRILSRYPRILILGGQGTGKSCLAFWLLEIIQNRARCYVYRLPEIGRSYIPEWLGILQEFADAPAGSIVLVDEAYLIFFSRDSQTKTNREITRIVNLARQKNIGLIFVAHESRHLERNILSGIDTLVIKKPAPLQAELDRSFLRSYLLKAQRIFQGKSDVSAKSASYICFSPSGFEGVLENPKSSFWSEALSHIFASGNLGKQERPARELSKEEKRKRAKKLRNDYGYSYGEIARDLGLGKTTVYRWLNESGTKR